METQNYGGVHISNSRTYSSEVVDMLAEGPASCVDSLPAAVGVSFQYNLHFIPALLLSVLFVCIVITVFMISLQS